MSLAIAVVASAAAYAAATDTTVLTSSNVEICDAACNAAACANPAIAAIAIAC